MADQWQFGFMVSATQDFETRYAEVKGTQLIPTICEPDVTAAHDFAVSQLASNDFVKPFEVYLSGTRNYSSPGDIFVAVQVRPDAGGE